MRPRCLAISSPRHFWLHAALLSLILALLSGCASLQFDFEPPLVDVVSLRLVPGQGMEQRLAIGLRISNPNAEALELQGMSYRLKLQGHDVLSGVKGDIPSIPGYTSTNIELEAAVSLLGSARVLQELLRNPQQSVSYSLDAKLDPRGRLRPSIRLQESGDILLGANR